MQLSSKRNILIFIAFFLLPSPIISKSPTRKKASQTVREKEYQKLIFNLNKPIYEAVRKVGQELDTYPQLQAVCLRYAPPPEIEQQFSRGNITGFHKKGSCFDRVRNAEHLRSFIEQKN